MKAKPVFLGYSWIGWLNLLILQWMFVRLEATIDTDSREIIHYHLIGFILPATGWMSDYIWLFKKFEI